MPHADLVFTRRPRLHREHRALARDRRRGDRRPHRRGRRRRCPRADRTEDRGGRPRGPDAGARASRTRTCTRSRAASSCCAATSTRASTEAEYLDDRRPRTRRIIRTTSGSSAAAGACRRSPAARRPRHRSTACCPIARRSCRTATVTARGSTPPRCGSPASTGTRPTRPTDASSATRDGEPDRHAARGRDVAREPAAARRPRVDTLTEALLRGQEYLHSYGITAWQDAIIGEYSDLIDAAPAYLRAAADGTLTARVVGAIWWDRTQGLEQIPSILERRERYRGGRFAATSVKIMQDGVAENFTAAMLEPYHDGHGHFTDNSGISFVPPEILNEAVPLLDAEGFQVHFHAIGDRAVRQCLDAVEHAIARNGRGDNRHHIAHIQVVHPDDIARFRRARRGREHAVAVGRARAADGRPDTAVPRLAAGCLAVPVRRPAARRAPCSPRAATGRSRRRTRSPRSTSR